ncbi:ImmA/IrrE family metallo-endopeptidase [Mitsuaria sp. CC2]|jgi:Zn-dependent peptidase ImmA (M78 family)|uniref:ImmA/IrrE family metallo-endopeptidase n=1 Tax=Mitsuaria sp. CC2 TaxID=3029186 RepID=UPI003B8E09D7
MADAPLSCSPPSPSPSPSPAPSLTPSSQCRDARSPAEVAERHRTIDALVDQLRKAHWDQATLPLDPHELADGAGVEVRDRGGAQEPMYPYRGRLLYLDDRPVIELNLAEEPMRRRIVLAHALGHHVLGHGLVPPETAPNLSSHSPHRIEQEAHRFALDLLMPDFAIYRLMNQGVVSARRLSEKFLVPESAMHERLQALDRHWSHL